MAVRVRQNLPVLIALVILLLFGWSVIGENALTEKPERMLLDTWFQLRGERDPGEEIVIVAIDDASLQQISGWPWPRTQLLTLLDSVLVASPALVVIDQILANKSAEREATLALAERIRSTQNVILPVYFTGLGFHDSTDTAGSTPPFLSSSSYLLFDFQEKFALYPPLRARAVQSSAFELASASLPTGHINIISEEYAADRTIRHEAHIIAFRDDYFPSLPVQAVIQYQGLTRGEVRVAVGESIQLASVHVPIDERGWSLINYYGPAGRFPVISATELLRGHGLDRLQGKIVLIGVTAAGTGDVLQSPFSARMQGVEKLATSIANILQGDTLARTATLDFFAFFLFVLTGLFLLHRLRQAPPALILVMTGVLVVILAVFAFFVFTQMGMWLRVAGTQLALLSATGAFVLVRSLLPGQEAAPAPMTLEHAASGAIKRIGQYEIKGEIGSGAMGKIYEGFDARLKRRVAIKIIRSEVAFLGGEKIKQRFLREAQAAGGLAHPNIVTIYNIEETGTLMFIVMEFLEGKTLEEIIQRETPLPLKRIVQLLTPVCEALEFAHKSGIVHRDIKPGNIMVLTDGRVKLMDFGIAHVSHSTMTMEGAVLGTPNYMSPEQLAGEIVDARTDIFALGVLLYEMATGYRPFSGNNLDELSANISSARYRPALLLNDTLPPEFDELLMRCLAADPDKRFTSTAELREALLALPSTP